MLPALVSIFIGTIVTVGLLLITRRRLSRQFEDIERRLIGAERALESIKLEMERSTTGVQLQRLHLGLVRTQEDAARRHESLLPATSRSLSERQLAALQEWATALDVPVEIQRIQKLARAVECAETLSPGDIRIETLDLFAVILALLGQPERPASIALAGVSAGSLAPLFAQMAAGFFEGIEVLQIPDSTGESHPPGLLTAMVCDADAILRVQALLPCIKENGILVLQETAGPERVGWDFPGFKLVADEWNTRVYRNLGES